MRTVRDVRKYLVQVARQEGRRRDEAEDLAHDLLVSALRRGLDLQGDAFLRSARMAARQHGAFLARSALRRRAREHLTVSVPYEVPLPPLPISDGPLPPNLSAPLRTTLLLLLQGLEKPELRSVLGLEDTALRKRFEALRKRAPLPRPNLLVVPRTSDARTLRRLQVSVLARLGPERRFGTADPDGHGLFFVEALTPGHPAATHGAAPISRTPSKGTPCSTASSRTSPSSSSSRT
jgi:DNA-directed RNA polymerase specialized sigma24 family protein